MSYKIVYGSAASWIEASIDNFETIRSDCHWDLLWQEIVAFGGHRGIEMSHS